MALSEQQRSRIVALARERGVDPEEALEAAESMSGGRAEGGAGDPVAADGKPLAERFLIGFLPYVRVREFREIWLGLDARVPDDELMTGEWLDLHGQQAGRPAGGDE